MAAETLMGLWARLRSAEPPGAAGEGLACRYLEAHGYRVLCRNYRCRSGEVDIVAREDAGTVVFVEVKERHAGSHGEGHEAVTFGKRRRVIRAARLYAVANGLDEKPVRFDVISIRWVDGRPGIRHDQGAFDSAGA